ncbi:MAG: T9SS type A sorting domain-containing protein [Flavobacteriales bacterium]
MKSILLSGLAIAASLQMAANDPQFIVEKVDNNGLVAGNTYRVYVQLQDEGQSVHAVWGDLEHPLMIESTAPFYQNALCGASSRGFVSALAAVDPTTAYDSYISLGYKTADANTLWDIGVDFTTFEDGGEILANNGSWFLLPTDAKTMPQEQGLVFFGQFTTSGVATGKVNLQGKNADGSIWRAYDVSFTTANAQTFGCTNSAASNFNAEATFDDGSCDTSASETSLSVETIAEVISEDWSVFPNPVRDQLIHIQFNSDNAQNEKYRIEIFDLSGKLISANELSSGAWVAGNRVTIEQALAAGTYKIVLSTKEKSTSKTLVVAK